MPKRGAVHWFFNDAGRRVRRRWRPRTYYHPWSGPYPRDLRDSNFYRNVPWIVYTLRRRGLPDDVIRRIVHRYYPDYEEDSGYWEDMDD